MTASIQARGIEAIAVRRTTIVDADKVRYRVYSSPTEFVAVIAESALMAVKVAGIAEPYRIVRDLPTREIAIEAEKIAKAEAVEKVPLSIVPKAEKLVARTGRQVAPTPLHERFVPMKLRDLNTKRPYEGFIVPHEILNQLLEAVRKPAPPPAAIPARPEQEPSVIDELPPELADQAPKEPVAAVPEAAPKQEAAPPVPPPAGDSGTLSPEEVNKLLNE